ncbi:NnrS family protein [Roseateles sp. DB2]|uniref:NnrS family protein n=1 Tax=Roseateles sp. DB2 TaxID=3453717 RepID=UPI003EEF40BD
MPDFTKPERHALAKGRRSPLHVPFFQLGLLMLALGGLWWCLALLARWLGWPLPWAVLPGLSHGLLFGLGAMPLFIAGFFLTAGSRWLCVQGPAPAALRPALLLTGLGWALVLPGLHALAPLAALGLLLVSLGWAGLWWHAGQMLAASEMPDRLHLRGVHGAWFIGCCGMAFISVSLLVGRQDWARQGLQAVLWWSLLPVFLLALHRMVPMFAEPAVWLHAGVRGPASERSLLWIGLAGCAWGGAWQILAEVVLPVWVWGLRAALDGGVALLLLTQAWHWRSMARLPLMAMLLCGGLWLAVGAALSALSCGLRAVGAVGLGVAPLHAVLAGGLASLMMAQVSRITSAHAGRSLAVDPPLVRQFLLLQAALALRLWVAFFTADAGGLLVLAALLWASAMAGWAVHLLRWMRQGANPV